MKRRERYMTYVDYQKVECHKLVEVMRRAAIPELEMKLIISLS